MTRLLILLALIALLAGCGGDATEVEEPATPGTHWVDLGDDVAVTVRTFEHEGRQITCVFSYDSYHGDSSGVDCPEWLNRR